MSEATVTHKVTLEVVGKRPFNEPYLWIGDAEGGYLDSLDEDEMRRLRDDITAAIRRR